ncbi:DUF488 family protein [Microbacterium barkeri]|uniref:DUF488 domain-containing protein n=1 Tax=Microbacterium barkeri TaxID=33917 RepID=UPI0024AF039E|nr:DUF488 family protein [Microbacterium barkeri]MDI6941896.1 DUF488 family protein [Microbacterium barkeri]
MARVTRLKRVYDAAEADDGWRVLVDRLWPRGVSRERAALDAWAKDVAPSPELRTAWHRDPARFEEFAQRYRDELDANPALDELRAALAEHAVVTLVYGARDPEHNHAVVLRDHLEEHP